MEKIRDNSVVGVTCLHEDQAQGYPTEELQSLADTMQEVNDIVAQNRLYEVQMTQWWKSDPLLGAKQSPLLSALSSKDTPASKAAFFKIDRVLSDEDLEGQPALLKRGIDIVQLLSDPAYTAQNEYAELDDEWLARMLGCARGS